LILLFGLIAGLLGGLAWAQWRKLRYRAPDLRFLWLGVSAFVPQLIIAYLPATRGLLPDRIAAISLSASLIIFAIFAWLNRRLPGMPILLAGLVLNLIVMLANGGWMPISPRTASTLINADVLGFLSLGSRFGEKDILLAPWDTKLEFLADRFLLPAWFPYRVAFSLGDVLIGIGAFWLLVNPQPKTKAPLTKEVVL
jgi:hypothetical protein